jgi:outer membrane protein OmpA-like peptidoglycan-associated protein
MWRDRAAVLAVVVLAASGAAAQENVAGEVIDLELPAPLGLVFQVENLGGQVQSLQVRETATEARIELPADILFDFDKFDIRPSAEAALKQAADILRQRAKGTVRIEGHTDAKGTPAYNQTLSQRRAESVRNWLIQREGLTSVKFATQGFAAAKPVAPNAKPDGSDDPEGRQKNRRVEIVFAKR